MSLSRGLRAALVACALLAVGAPAASADSTVGPSSADLGNAGDWTAGNLTLSASTWIWTAPDVVATESGTVTSWRIRTGVATGTVQLMVLHPTGGGWQIAAETTAQPVAVLGVNTYVANLPIQAGDTIAVTGDNTQLRAGSGAATSYRWQGHPTTVGTVLGTPELTLGSFRLGFSADITAAATPTPVVEKVATTGPTALGLAVGTGSSGGVTLGNGLAVRGANMNLVTQVYFNNVPATQWWIDGFDQISVIVPPGLPDGPVTLRVGGVGGVNEDTPGTQVNIRG